MDVLGEEDPPFGLIPEELDVLALEARAKAEPRIRRQLGLAILPVAVLALILGACVISLFGDLL